MSTPTPDVEARLARFVEHHVLEGEHLDIEMLCADRPDLAAPLRALVERYLSLTESLEGGTEAGLKSRARGGGTEKSSVPQDFSPASVSRLRIDGFETIERIGAGGMGEVFKLRDLRLNRLVAAKVVRTDRSGWKTGLGTFLREARALALFSDRRIVQIHEVRPDCDPPVIIMEYVEGFELGRLGPSLEFAQRARILAEVCEAVHHAHTVGVQHRDLKPSNIMLDSSLAPRVLDFGLSTGDSAAGHFVGTLPYVAPEQLDRSQPIDARTDVYALGVILYELVSGRPPFEGDDRKILDSIRFGTPRLPSEVNAAVPEPLQAIALTAMERDPGLRYQSALDMATDLRRYLAGHAVSARPSVYATTLHVRSGPHLEDIREWLRLRLIYPHEAERLRSAYAALEAREDDWIVASRALTHTQIALYLGAFLLVCGSLFYFIAARWYENVDGVLRPVLVLALPFVGLNATAHFLYGKDHKAVGVAFYLAAIALLPLFLLILFHETGFLVAASDDPRQLFGGGAVSNRQLQITSLVASAWACWLALRTRTTALSTIFAVLLFLFATAVIADLGLRTALDEQRWDTVALRFLPLVLIYAGLGFSADTYGSPWLSRPAYFAGAAIFVVSLELLALDGRALVHLGLSLAPWQSAGVSDRTLLDTVTVMTLNGALFYAAGSLLVRHGSGHAQDAAQLLFAIAPFALLHPLGYLVRTSEYSPRVDWIYAAAALLVALLSERRQRRAFYYAGLLNLGLALYYIALHRDWFEHPVWGMAVIGLGLAALAAGFLLARTRHP